MSWGGGNEWQGRSRALLFSKTGERRRRRDSERVVLPEGARVLITGASSGIGAATAERLSRRGVVLLLSGRNEPRTTEMAARTGGHALVADLSVPAGPRHLVQQALEVGGGRLDAVIHCAGIGLAGPLEQADVGALAELVAVNVTATLVLAAAALGPMRAAGRGHVVLVGSVAGRTGVAGEAAYSATKGAVSLLAQSLDIETAGSGVSISLISPGPVATPFFARRGTPYGRRWPRPVPADDVARAIERALATRAPEIWVPSWLGLVPRVRAATPALYRRAARRFG